MDALEIRMAIKELIKEARLNHPDFEFLGEVDELDVVIEALIKPEVYEIAVRLRHG